MIASLVPQIFYDIIARVIPGIVLFVACYVTILGPAKAVKNTIAFSSGQNLFSFGAILLFIVLSYVLGIVLSELWSLTFGKIKNQKTVELKRKYLNACLLEIHQMRKFLGESELELKEENLPSIYVMHDHLRIYSPSESYRLLKLRAEERLCEVLFSGLIPLAIVNLWCWYYIAEGFSIERTVFEIALLIGMFLMWKSSNRLEKFYVNGTCRAWLFFSFPSGAHKSILKESVK